MATAFKEEDEYCFICCKHLTRPKILPCSHVFCEDCLQSHIDYNSTTYQLLIGFSCPVCCKHVNPVNANISKSRWAGDFENYEEFCKCLKHPSELTDIKCLTCDRLFCCRCIMLLHRNCEIRLTENTVAKLKWVFGKYFDYIKTARNSVVNSIDVLDNSRDEIVNRIRTLNEELVTIICVMEQKTLTNIFEYYEAHSEHLKSVIEKKSQALNTIEQNFEEMDTLLATENPSYTLKECTQKIADHLLRYVFLPGGFEVSKQFEVALENMKKLKMAEFLPPGKFTLHKDLHINPLRETRCATGTLVERELDDTCDVAECFDINPFAETGDTTGTLLEPEFYIDCPEELYLKHEFEIKHNGEIIGDSIDFLMLSNNSILISDRSHCKLWRFSPDGKCLCQKQFEQIPYSLCELRNNRVVVSFPENMTLKIINCLDLTVINNYIFSASFYSIFTPDNEQIFCLFHSQKLFVRYLVFDEAKGFIKRKLISVPRTTSLPIYCKLQVLRSGLLLVSDLMNTNFTCFNQAGTCLYNYALLDNPTAILDIAIDEDSIYFLYAEYFRIRKLHYSGTFQLDIKIPHETLPNCMSITDSGQLVLIDIKDDCPKLRIYQIRS